MNNDMRTRIGHFVTSIAAGEEVNAYLPPPLPPDPPIELARLVESLSRAERALGRLDGASSLLPDLDLFLYMYVRKEAVLSSQIEGTQSTLTDLLRFETEALDSQPIDDIREVSNYVDAMRYGLERMAELPLSLRLIREMHVRLLNSTRGATKSPGEFRTSQNWIGGTRPGNALFVPPPPHEVMACLGDLETFLHTEDGLPVLIKAGLIHLQFETIHPFLDGNGRIGRLLITLFLCANGVLKEPLLYLSLYFKTHRQDYYRLLQEVREHGTWETWLEFFLNGVAETANQAFESAGRIASLIKADRSRITTGSERGNAALTKLRVHEFLQTSPYSTSQKLVQQTQLTAPTVNAALRDLEELGIIEEVTGKKRGRVYAYTAYLNILNDGTDTPPDAG